MTIRQHTYLDEEDVSAGECRMYRSHFSTSDFWQLLHSAQLLYLSMQTVFRWLPTPKLAEEPGAVDVSH